jgi:hypothetical protein
MTSALPRGAQHSTSCNFFRSLALLGSQQTERVGIQLDAQGAIVRGAPHRIRLDPMPLAVQTRQPMRADQASLHSTNRTEIGRDHKWASMPCRRLTAYRFCRLRIVAHISWLSVDRGSHEIDHNW